MVFKLINKEGRLSGKGITNIFEQSKIKKNDIDALQKFNNLLADTTGRTNKLDGVTKIYKQTMSGTTSDAKKLANQIASGSITIEQATGSINKMSLSSQAAAAGMKALAVAGNMVAVMAAAWALQKLVEGIDYVIHEEEKLAEKSSTLKMKIFIV